MSNVNAMSCQGRLQHDVPHGGEYDLDVLGAGGGGEMGVDGFVGVVAFGDVLLFYVFLWSTQPEKQEKERWKNWQKKDCFEYFARDLRSIEKGRE